MDRHTARIVLIVLGVVAFLSAAASAFGWIDGNASGLALVGFGCWLASTLP